MVVFYHIGLAEESLFGGHALVAPFTRSWNSGVDLFFVISGFVMMTISTGRFHQRGSSRTFFLRRAARIYPLYWFYTSLYVILLLCRPGFIFDTRSLFDYEILRSVLLFPAHGQPILLQGWTLVFELYFYIVFALILWLPERQRMSCLALWGLIIVGCIHIHAGLLKASPVIGVVTNALTLEFLTGCTIAYFVNRGIHRHSVLALICAVAAFVAVSSAAHQGAHVAFYIGPASLAVYGAVSIEARHRFQFPQWLRFVGDWSYSLYLSHFLSFSCVRYIWASFHFPQSIASDISFTAFSIACVIVVGAISYRWVEKPLLGCAYVIVSKLTSFGCRKSSGSEKISFLA